MEKQNKFGALSKEYRAARKGYPKELFTYLQDLIGKEHVATLDLGCGTGIATRELKEYDFDVIGADKEDEMIDKAKQESSDTPYIIASAEKIPFESERFDLVTAFTSFHWFNNEEALTEIWRVLKKGGVFFAAVKINRKTEDTEQFRKGYQAIFKKYAGEHYSNIKNHSNKEFLTRIFTNLAEKSFNIEERSSIEESLTLVRSLSLWNLVSDEDKPKMLEELKDFYEQNLVDGFVLQKREIATIAGFKE